MSTGTVCGSVSVCLYRNLVSEELYALCDFLSSLHEGVLDPNATEAVILKSFFFFLNMDN